MISLVVAYNSNQVIGDANGKMPWHIPDDLKYFKEITIGKPCIMGRKTWDSIPEKFKPLPGRTNLIVTRKQEAFIEKNLVYLQGENPIIVCDSVEDAISKAQGINAEICVIGGGEIYRDCIEKGLADRVLASEIKGFEDITGTTFFPRLKYFQDWKPKVVKEFKDFVAVEYQCTNPKQPLSMDQNFES